MPAINPDDSLPSASPAAHDPYSAIRNANFRRYWAGSIVSILGMQMQSVTVIWEIFQRTGRPFDVGLVGLVQVIPVLSLALLAGHVADRVDRRKVLMGAVMLSGVASLGLAAVSYFQWNLGPMFACLFLVGVARAFQQPAKNSFLPQLVPREIFSNAVTWNLGGFQLASVVGPALGGWALALFGYAYFVYLFQATAATVFLVLLSRIERVATPPPPENTTLRSVGDGIAFVWQKKVILGAMALDMFAVLLGGATALLPVFAKDILEVGPVGYGLMASAPAVGAVLMSLALVHRPPMAKAGQTLLWSVAGFGAAIIVFGLSTSLWVSLAALVATGAFDCVSVVIRHTLVQMLTPDPMRGRVSAISGMFISASNELGEFESGTLASLTSPVFAVVSGGIGTILVVVTAALAIPQLRRYGRLDSHDYTAAEPEPAVDAV